MLLCSICGRECLNFNSLAQHVRSHGITSKLYYDTFLKQSSDEGFCKICKNPTNFDRISTGYKSYCCRRCQAIAINSSIDMVKRQVKIKTTKLKRYGDENYNNTTQAHKTFNAKTDKEKRDIIEKRKQTCLDNFGVEYPMQSDAVKHKWKTNYQYRTGFDHPLHNPEVIDKIIKTNITKYGTTNPSKTDEVKNRIKATKLLKYDDANYNNLKQIRKTCLERYGAECCWGNHDIRLKCRTRYLYKNVNFDSSYELMLYIYLEDHNIDFEYQPDIYFEYYYNDKKIRYFPDFKIQDKIYELKGSHFFENGKLINPYNREEDDLYECKHQCMKRNDVIILKSEDMTPLITYINTKYGNNYLSNFRKRNKDDSKTIMDAT